MNKLSLVQFTAIQISAKYECLGWEALESLWWTLIANELSIVLPERARAIAKRLDE